MTLTTLRLSKPYGTISFREAGLGAPIVMVHGVGMQSAAWLPQIEALSVNHRVIAVDMPGHGGSAALPKGSQLPDYVDWLHAVISALDLREVSLAGHSMGALIAAGYAVTYPSLLSRVALLNAVYLRSESARTAVIARAEQIRSEGIDVETPLARWFADTAADSAARDDVARWLRAVDLDGYATAYGAFARGDAIYADQLHEIRLPFLAVTGDLDLNSTPEMALSMANAVPKGRGIVIKGHRHMVNLTAPDEVNAALEAWMTMEPEGETV